MALEAIILALLFFEPAYYRLKAKGWPAGRIVWAAIMAMVAGWIAVRWLPAAGWLALATPVALLASGFLLPARPGAPGPDYLYIRLTCPSCSRSFALRRRHEGRAVLCPTCEGLIHVPAEGDRGLVIDASRRPPRRRPDAAWECINRSLHPLHADFARSRLESAGIACVLADEIAAFWIPYVNFAGGGVRVLVAPEDRPAAEAVLAETEYPELPPDADYPPAVAERAENDGVALFLWQLILIVFLAPIVLVGLWELVGPWIAPGAFDAEGRLDAHTRASLSLYIAGLGALMRIGSAVASRARIENAPSPG